MSVAQRAKRARKRLSKTRPPPINTDGSDPIATSNLLIAAGAVLRTVA